jgi:AcrR family transcriptional regulator
VSIERIRPTLRDERAEVTRRRITEAARALFAVRGYGATTLRSVAAEAGVAVQTIYAVYGSKPGLLNALRDSVVGQPEAEALFRAALMTETGARKIELFAGSIRRRWENGHDVVTILRDAAAIDPQIRAEVAQVMTVRRAGIDRLASSLQDDLAVGLDAARAAAVIDALTLPEVYEELTVVQGWTADEYEAWLARSLAVQLLRV